jgi:hypothetical protein
MSEEKCQVCGREDPMLVAAAYETAISQRDATIASVYALAKTPVEQAEQIPLAQWVQTRFVHVDDHNAALTKKDATIAAKDEMLRKCDAAAVESAAKEQAALSTIAEQAAEIEAWKAATLLDDASGDPDGITPAHCEREITGLRAEIERLNKIATPCPSCGRTSLFIGTGGHLTCSFIGCKEPGVERYVASLRSVATTSVESCQRLWNSLYDSLGGPDMDNSVRRVMAERQSEIDGARAALAAGKKEQGNG